MSASKMLFVGIRGAVLALDKASGASVWVTELKGSDFVRRFFLGVVLVLIIRFAWELAYGN